MNDTDTVQLLGTMARMFPDAGSEWLQQNIADIELYANKNHDFAHGGDTYGNFKRVGTILGLYPGLDIADPQVVGFVYMLKQLDAWAHLKSQRLEAKVEGGDKRMQDVRVYAGILPLIDEVKE
jgi:hypothetical protein